MGQMPPVQQQFVISTRGPGLYEFTDLVANWIAR